VLSALGGSQVGIDNEAQEVKAWVHAPQPVVEKVGCGGSPHDYVLAGFPSDFGMKTAQKAGRVMAIERGQVLYHSQTGRVAMVHRGPVWCQDDVQVPGKRSVAPKVPVSYDLVCPVIWQRCPRQLRNKARSPVSPANEHARPGGYSKTANSLDHLFHPDFKFVQEQVKIERLT